MKIFLTFIIILFAIFFSGCEDNPSNPDDDLPERVLSGVLIGNEGGFSAANASLSFLDLETGIMYHNVFSSANNKDLGSVVQSIYVVDTLAYVVVTNSDKIEVISSISFKRVLRINLPSGTSPRYMAFVDKNTAYVSSLYKNLCYLLDLNNGVILDSAQVGSNPEEITISNGKLYIANSGFGYGNTVSVISIESNQFVSEIVISDNPQTLKKDQNGFIYVLGTGSYGSDYLSPDDDTPAYLWKIDPADDSVVDTVKIDGHPSRLALGDDNKGYFIGTGGIVKFDMQSLNIENEALIPGFYYNIFLNSQADHIYLMDAKDYQQNGELIVFDLNGVEQNRYETGQIPGSAALIYR